MDFTRINKVGRMGSDFLPVKSLSELILEKDYLVTGMRAVETKWGKRVVIEVGNAFACYLPARVAKAFEEDAQLFQQMVSEASNRKLILQYFGSDFNHIEFKSATE